MTALPRFAGADDEPIVGNRRDFSGGVNSRQEASIIGENQATLLYNVDLGTPGETSKRPGSVFTGTNYSRTYPVLGLHNFEIQGETDQLLMYSGTTLENWTGSGEWSVLKNDFNATVTEVGMVNTKKSGLSPDDVVIIQNLVDDPYMLDSDGNLTNLGHISGTGSDAPPKSNVMASYGNRLWVLLNDLLYFSDAYPANLAIAFDTVSNSFRVPVGEERGICPTRDTGMIIMGKEQIWGLAPSATPVATDTPEPIVTNRGVVSKKGWVNAGDDIYYFANDGFRALRRTVQDKLQAGIDNPLSFNLKDEYSRINFGYIERLAMEYFDNKIFISVPTGADTFDTWVYYTATQGFMVITGWSSRCWATYKISGEEQLYYGRH